jgi:hypothetical protein
MHKLTIASEETKPLFAVVEWTANGGLPQRKDFNSIVAARALTGGSLAVAFLFRIRSARSGLAARSVANNCRRLVQERAASNG